MPRRRAGVENLREMGDKAVNFMNVDQQHRTGPLGRALLPLGSVGRVRLFRLLRAHSVSNASKFRTRHNLESFIKAPGANVACDPPLYQL